MRARTLTLTLFPLSACSPDAGERATALDEAGVTPVAVRRSRVAFQTAMDALDAGDAAAYLLHVREAADLRPQHPTLIYHLARGRGGEPPLFAEPTLGTVVGDTLYYVGEQPVGALRQRCAGGGA